MTENKTSLVAKKHADGTQSVQVDFTDSLPNPMIVAQWQQLYPGAAEVIMEMAKKEQTNRHANDQSDRWLKLLGQFTSFIIILAGLAACVFLIYSGKSLEGLALVLAPLGGVATVVWYFKGEIKEASFKKKKN